ncbi:MAG TPA: hypothetical protein VJ839_03005 [Candidatus Limnocylindria bacterium]|nr:hypothetical protein [Candidatus Limnocylindria bacterium]
MIPRTFRGGTILLVVLLAACSPSASASPSRSAHPTSQEPSIAPSESAAALCDPGVVCAGPLAAGDYVSEATGARIEFTLDDHDWSGLPDTPGVGFGLLLADVPDAAISALTFGGESFTDPCDPNAGLSSTGITPAEFIAMLSDRTGVAAGEPVEVEVGGRPGLQVDLTTAIDADCAATGDGQIWVWPLPGGGTFDLEDMEQARITAVDGGRVTVILIAEARSIVEDYDHFLEHATEVFDSMTITPL